MFNALLNYSASTYEAIILAFIVVGLIQTIALWRKANQFNELKKAVVQLAGSATKALIHAARETAAAVQRARDAERLAMELRADADDADDDRAGSDPFADLFRRAREHDPIAHLIERLGGDRRSAQFDPMGGTFNREPTDPDLSADDLKDALTGDLAGIERRHGALPGSVQVEILRADGQPVSDGERKALLDALNRGDGRIEGETRDLTTLNEYAHGFEDQGPSGAPNFGVKVEHIDAPYQSPRAG